MLPDEIAVALLARQDRPLERPLRALPAQMAALRLRQVPHAPAGRIQAETEVHILEIHKNGLVESSHRFQGGSPGHHECARDPPRGCGGRRPRSPESKERKKEMQKQSAGDRFAKAGSPPARSLRPSGPVQQARSHQGAVRVRGEKAHHLPERAGSRHHVRVQDGHELRPRPGKTPVGAAPEPQVSARLDHLHPSEPGHALEAAVFRGVVHHHHLDLQAPLGRKQRPHRTSEVRPAVPVHDDRRHVRPVGAHGSHAPFAVCTCAVRATSARNTAWRKISRL